MGLISLVVINEHTLGYLIPNTDYAGILHASILRGSSFNPMTNIYVKFHKVRLASEQDFNNYRVSFKGFDNPKEYKYNS